MKIGILGAPLSGKTTILRKLEDKGYKVFRPDLYVSKLYEKDQPLYVWVKEKFGDDYVNDYEVDKRMLAEEAIKNRELVKELEEKIMPLVNEQMETDEVIIVEPSGAKIDFDKVVLVEASKDELKKRYKKHFPEMDDEFLDTILDKWDNNIKFDISIDTSNGVKDEDIEKIIEILK